MIMNRDEQKKLTDKIRHERLQAFNMKGNLLLNYKIIVFKTFSKFKIMLSTARVCVREMESLSQSLLLSLLVVCVSSSEGPTPIVLWHGMGDSCCNPISMGSIKVAHNNIICSDISDQ